MGHHEQLSTRLWALLKSDENQTCVDCLSSLPTWAALVTIPPGCNKSGTRIGALCCFECSKAHRVLGTKVSLVRDVDEDNWKEHEVEAMEKGGNAKVNSIFEAKSLDALREKMNCNSEMRENFIRQKYQNLKYFEIEALANLAGASSMNSTAGQSAVPSGRPTRRNSMPQMMSPKWETLSETASRPTGVRIGELPRISPSKAAVVTMTRQLGRAQSHRNLSTSVAKESSNANHSQRRKRPSRRTKSNGGINKGSGHSQSPRSSGSESSDDYKAVTLKPSGRGRFASPDGQRMHSPSMSLSPPVEEVPDLSLPFHGDPDPSFDGSLKLEPHLLCSFSDIYRAPLDKPIKRVSGKSKKRDSGIRRRRGSNGSSHTSSSAEGSGSSQYGQPNSLEDSVREIVAVLEREDVKYEVSVRTNRRRIERRRSLIHIAQVEEEEEADYPCTHQQFGTDDGPMQASLMELFLDDLMSPDRQKRTVTRTQALRARNVTRRSSMPKLHTDSSM